MYVNRENDDNNYQLGVSLNAEVPWKNQVDKFRDCLVPIETVSSGG